MSSPPRRAAPQKTPFTHFLAPRYWGLWSVLISARLLSLLPVRMQHRVGAWLGRVGVRFFVHRREIARRNLAACFPELDEQSIDALVREHFENLGIALFETPTCWWSSDKRIEPLGEAEGVEHLERALEKGKGVILLTAHFTCLEMGARLMCRYTPLHVMYRRHDNPLMQEMLQRTRAAHAEHIFDRNDVRSLIRSLKRNKAVWFAPDQKPVGHHDSVLAPFFGVQALTNTSPARLARLTGAAVVPYFPERTADGRYRLHIGEALNDFPTGDDVADAARINALIEAHARRAPASYLWIHRRFKGRPPEYPDLYAGLR
jgi:KDO2-lipid IV(A) lauroyltransferase